MKHAALIYLFDLFVAVRNNVRNFLLAFWISFAISVNGLISRRDIKLKFVFFFILIVLPKQDTDISAWYTYSNLGIM